jgi:hypothetical protein
MREMTMYRQNENDRPQLRRLLEQFDLHDPTVSDGAAKDDDVFKFCYNPAQYDWLYIGKKEVLVPYGGTPGKLRVPQHPAGLARSGTEGLRWELHSVWIIDGVLRRGESNVLARRRFYLEGSSWMILLGDGYNSSEILVKYYMRYLCPDEYCNRAGQWYSIDASNSSVAPNEGRVPI